jgi:hypothetical protein
MMDRDGIVYVETVVEERPQRELMESGSLRGPADT